MNSKSHRKRSINLAFKAQNDFFIFTCLLKVLWRAIETELSSSLALWIMQSIMYAVERNSCLFIYMYLWYFPSFSLKAYSNIPSIFCSKFVCPRLGSLFYRGLIMLPSLETYCLQENSQAQISIRTQQYNAKLYIFPTVFAKTEWVGLLRRWLIIMYKFAFFFLRNWYKLIWDQFSPTN